MAEQEISAEMTSIQQLTSEAQNLLQLLHNVESDQLPALIATNDAELEHSIRSAGISVAFENDVARGIRGLSDLAARGSQLWSILGEEAAVAEVEALRSTMSVEDAGQLQRLVDLVVYGAVTAEGNDIGESSGEQHPVQDIPQLVQQAQTLLSAVRSVDAELLPGLIATSADDSDALEACVRRAGVSAEDEAEVLFGLRGLSDLAVRGSELWAELGEAAAVAQIEVLRSTMSEADAGQLQLLVNLVVYGTAESMETEAQQNEEQNAISKEESSGGNGVVSEDSVEVASAQAGTIGSREDKGSLGSMSFGSSGAKPQPSVLSTGSNLGKVTRSMTGSRLIDEEEEPADDRETAHPDPTASSRATGASSIGLSSQMMRRRQSQRRAMSSVRQRTATEPVSEGSDSTSTPGGSRGLNMEAAAGEFSRLEPEQTERSDEEGDLKLSGRRGDNTEPSIHESSPGESAEPAAAAQDPADAPHDQCVDVDRVADPEPSSEHDASVESQVKAESDGSSADAPLRSLGLSSGMAHSDRYESGPLSQESTSSNRRALSDEEAVAIEAAFRQHLLQICEAMVLKAIEEATAMLESRPSSTKAEDVGEEELQAPDGGELRRMNSELLQRRQSTDIEVTAFSSIQAAPAAVRGEIAGEASVSDLIEDVLSAFASVELVEMVHDEVRGRLAALVGPMRYSRASLEKVDERILALDTNDDEDEDDDDGRAEAEREEQRGHLQIERRRNLTDLRSREKLVEAARTRLREVWAHAAPVESKAIVVLQHRMRCLLVQERYRAKRDQTSEAARLLLPHLQAFNLRKQYLFKDSTAARCIQLAYSCRLARRAYKDRVVESVCNEIVEYVREGFTFNIAHEERNAHREWLIAHANPSAALLQATLRRQLSPSMEALERKFAILTANAGVIHRAMRCMVRTTRHLRGVVTTVCVEDALMGSSMDRAVDRLYERAMLQLLQATLRRQSVMRARAGIVTAATVELAVTMAFNDSIENMWHQELDEMYEQPLVEFARLLLGVFHRRLLDRTEFTQQHLVATSCKAMFVRVQTRTEFLLQLDAVRHFRSLFQCLWCTRRYEEKRRVTLRVQRRARANALIYATRMHRRLVGTLVAAAKSNLSRRFYIHMLRVADHLVSDLSRAQTALPPPEPDTPPPETTDSELVSPVLRRRENRTNLKPKSSRTAQKSQSRAPVSREASTTSHTTATPLASPMTKNTRSPVSNASVHLQSESSKDSVTNGRIRVKFDSIATPSTRHGVHTMKLDSKTVLSKHVSTRRSSSSDAPPSVAGSRRSSVLGSGAVLSSQSVETISGLDSGTLSHLPQFNVRTDMCTLAQLALAFMVSLSEDSTEIELEPSRDELLDDHRRDSIHALASPMMAKPLPLTEFVSLGQDDAPTSPDDATAGGTALLSEATDSKGAITSEQHDDVEKEPSSDAGDVVKKFVAFCVGQSSGSRETTRCVAWLAESECELTLACQDDEDSELVLTMLSHFVRHVSGLSWPLSAGELGLEAKRVASLLQFFTSLRKPTVERAETSLADFEADAQNSDGRVGKVLLRSLLELCSAVVRGNTGMVEAEMEASTLEQIPTEIVRSSALEASLMVSWLSERDHEVGDLVKDMRYMEDASVWVTLWLHLIDHCYESKQIVPCRLLQDDEATSFMDSCNATMKAPFPAGEKPFKLYDNIWTIVPYPDQPDQYNKYLYKPCIPNGFALNASGIRVKVDPVKEDKTLSIFEAVFALSWSFGEDILSRIVPSVSSDLPLGVFGAMTARRRRERVRMWCDIATERVLCELLLHLVRCREGEQVAAACWVLSVLCVLPGRAVTFNSLGAVASISNLVRAGDHLSPETAAAAGLALQALLSDDFVASRVSPETSVAIARVVRRTENLPLQAATVHALRRIVEHNSQSAAAVLEKEWLPPTLVVLVLQVRIGHLKAAADAALAIAGLCSSASPTERVGAVAGVMEALTELARSEEPLCRSAALQTLLSLATTAENGLRMMSVAGLHELLVEVFNSDSLQFFTMCADLFCLLVVHPRVCTMTLQHAAVLSKLLCTVISTDQQTSTVSMRLIDKLATSVEASWVVSRDPTESNRDRMEANAINAELMLQFGQNVHALSVVCSMMSSPFPDVATMAARTLRSILRCSPEARRWLLKTDWAVQVLVRGISSKSKSVQRHCLWSVYDLAVPGAQVLFKHNVYMELKVLLYTAEDQDVQVAVVHALEKFVLGLDRVATPDQDMVEEITSRLRSEDPAEQDAVAAVVAQMITQDYIDLTVHVHEGRAMPQSDNWGYCDPFIIVKLNGQELRSQTERNTLSPKWDFKALVSVSDKSEDLVVELWDWDNAGDEYLGSLSLPCENLEELGDENRRVQIGRELGLQARKITLEADGKANVELEEGKVKEAEILEKGKEEAERLRAAMLEEARFLASDPKAEAKRIMAEATAEGEKLMAAVAGSSRVQEYRAAMEGERLKQEAKVKAAEVQKVWQGKTAGLSSDDVEERVEGYKRLAESKAERALKAAEKEAEQALMAHVRAASKLQKKAALDSKQLLDLRQGWYVPSGEDDKPLMGRIGTITGFDDNGNLTGDLDWAPSSIQMSFEYTVKVNVDRIVWGQDWVLGRCHELLLLEGRERLWVSVLRILRALTEDIEESRAAIGAKEGLLGVLAGILETPDVLACHMEACLLLQMLASEEGVVLAIVHQPHLMRNLKGLRRWKGTALGDVATATASRIDKCATRLKKQEALSRRNQRNSAAVEKKKQAAAATAAAGAAAAAAAAGGAPNPRNQADVAPMASPLAPAGASPLTSPQSSPLGGRAARRRPLVPASLSSEVGGTDDEVAAHLRALAMLGAPSLSSPTAGRIADEMEAETGVEEEEGEEEEEEGLDEEAEEEDRTDPDEIEDEKESDLSSLDLKGFLVRRRRASMVYA